MKKFLVLLVILFSLVLAHSAFAKIDIGSAYASKAAQKAGYSAATNANTFSANVGLVIRLLLSLVGVIFLTLTVYAGYLWMTASGESEKVEKAQKILTQAVIGLIIVISAYSITTFFVPAVVTYMSTGGLPSNGSGGILGAILNVLKL